MSAEINAEEGRPNALHEGFTGQNAHGFFRRALHRTVTLFDRANGNQVLEQEPAVEMIHVNRFATNRLSIERISQLVGSDAGSFDLQLAASDDGSSLQVEWSHDNIARLISHCGTAAINAIDPAEMSLLHASIVSSAIDCAEELFAYASTENLAVVLEWSEEDILGWAVKSQTKSSVDYVLRRILGKCSTPTESARVVRKHFHVLLKKFPGIVEKLLEADCFCFEYGRLQVPAEIFEWHAPLGVFKLPNKYSAATHSSDEIPWKAADSSEVKDFWMRNDTSFAAKMHGATSQNVTAVSKFICINCPFHAQPKTVLSHLISSKCSVEVFKSRAIKTMVQWRWQISSRNKQLGLLVVHLVLAVLFFMFAVLYRARHIEFYQSDVEYAERRWYFDPHFDPKDQLSKWYLALSFLRTCLGLVWSSLAVLYEPLLVPYAANVSYLYYHYKRIEFPPNSAVILLSVQCLLVLVSVMRAFRPFRLTGPFVSMVYYTLWDIIPYLLLGALMIVWFGMAVMVTLTSTDIEYNSDLATAENSFEYLFYAMLGSFEDKVNFEVGYHPVEICRSIVVYLFLMLGAVVLLSLLIAALSDTFDRVMLTREAKSIKARAVATESRGFCSLHWILSRVPFLRCYWRRPWQWFDADMTWIRLFSWLLLGCNRLTGARNRRRQLQKLQDFAHSTRRPVQESEPVKDVLIFHFLVPAESDIDTAKRPTWHGRILALVKMLERTFDRTCKSLNRNSDDTKQTMARVEQEMEAIKTKADEAKNRQQEQFDALEARVESIESNNRMQFEALMRRMDDISEAL